MSEEQQAIYYAAALFGYPPEPAAGRCYELHRQNGGWFVHCYSFGPEASARGTA